MKRPFPYLFICLIIFLSAFTDSHAAGFAIHRGDTVAIRLSKRLEPVAYTAAEMLRSDLNAVLGVSCPDNGCSTAKAITGMVDSSTVPFKEGFRIEVTPGGELSVTGSDSRGLAYGLLEISRLAGVSPWIWWADSAPQQLDCFSLPAGFVSEQHPDVEYRGIFINDEDWGFLPWAAAHETEGRIGRIGPESYSRLFGLLLRLRANTLWPAMHECTEPFFLVPGNREAAAEYGIFIGSSHCEPMACNAAGEWKRRGKGDYDFVNNRREVCRFWEKRLKEVKSQDIIYTLGMRGVHDGAMQGAKGTGKVREVLADVIATQREMLGKRVSKEILSVPQVFIPYKEVLDVYHAGLDVPDDVTLMWCDDNYGYIRHFPSETERLRKGGNGIYYHVSYWGRPHDYLWLATFSPELLLQQMGKAWDKGIRKMWILNVGDLKPAEYQTELFLDLAWNVQSVRAAGADGHLRGFLAREFGTDNAGQLTKTMLAHYRLALDRKPEFLGNTRTEEKTNPLANVVKDLPLTEGEINRRLEAYAALSKAVDETAAKLPENRRDCYYQLVEYPVKGAAQMNRKFLSAQLARHGAGSWSESRGAHDSIAALTARYNAGFSNGEKWNGIMDCRPRRLPVFNPVDSTQCDPAPLPVVAHTYSIPLSGELTEPRDITFTVPPSAGDSITLEFRFLPTHPVDGRAPGAAVSLDGMETVSFTYATVGRSEEWKENVLRNYASRSITVATPSPGEHTVTLAPLAEGVVPVEMLVYADPDTGITEELKGKRLCVFGDSYVRNHRRPFSETWHAKAARQLGLEYVNLGRNGSSIAFDRTKRGFGREMTYRAREIPDSTDIILIIAGHNDADLIAEGADPKAVEAAIDTLCRMLKRDHPEAAVGWVLPWDVDRAGFSEVRSMICRICGGHGIPVMDAGAAGGIRVNDDAFRSRFFQGGGVRDTAHLNDSGHNLVLPAGRDFIRSLVVSR